MSAGEQSSAQIADFFANLVINGLLAPARAAAATAR
jgi:hypothetical protein